MRFDTADVAEAAARRGALIERLDIGENKLSEYTYVSLKYAAAIELNMAGGRIGPKA